MESKINCGNGVTFVGFDTADNGKWIIEVDGNWTYVNYQRNEFARAITGYVVKQENGKYNAFNFMRTYDKLFDDKESAIEFVKKKYMEEKE